MEYGFNVEIAQKIGVNEAIMLRNFQYWIQKNKANDTNFHDGQYWTYNTVNAFCEIFPFWTENQIRNILKKLTALGILKKGDFNQNRYNKTVWYSINEDVLNNLLTSSPEQENSTEDEYKNYNEQIQNSPQSTETVDMVKLPTRYGKINESMCEISQLDTGNLTTRCGKFNKSITDVNTYNKPVENTHTHEGECVKISPDSFEVVLFFRYYRRFKNKRFTNPSKDDCVKVAEVLSKNGGFDKDMKRYWIEVFKNSARGWQIIEKGEKRNVPCPLERVLQDHSKIKARELGLLPPLKKVKKPVTVQEDVVIDEAAMQESIAKGRAIANEIRRSKICF